MSRTQRAVLLAALVLAAAGMTAQLASTGGANAASRAGGTLSIASVVDIDTLDPHARTFAWDAVVWPLVFDSLTRYTAGSGSSVRPGLAVSWSSTPDLRTYTFKLRQGVTFSNGKPVDAAAVAASINRVLDPATKSSLASQFKAVKSVVAVNPATVRIVLKQASVFLPDKLADIQILDTSPDVIASAKSSPIGSGPFVVKNFVPADHVTLVPNPSYWGKKSSLGEIKIVRAKDPSSAITSLNQGDLQALGNLGLDNIEAIIDGGKARVISAKSTAGAMMFTMDNTSPPFNNVYARQALAYATNRGAMLKAALSGVGTVATKNLPLPASLIDPSLPKITFNLKKANELFAKAGVKKGTTFTFWTVASQPFYSNEAVILQSDLAKIGFKLKIQPVDVAQWLAKLYPPPKKFPLFISSNWYSGIVAPQNLTLWTPGVCECQYNNKKFNALLAKAEGTRDPAKRQTLYFRAQRIMQQDSPTIIVSLTGIPIAVRGNVRGAWVDPRDIAHFEDVAVTGS